MKVKTLYQQLERDFIKPDLKDDWAEHMDFVSDFLSDNFKKRSMGLVCDFTDEINKVYCAVFPEKKVMQKIINNGAKEAMLFVHHPSIWDIRKAPEVFQQMDRQLLERFRKRKISIYNLHVPLDNFGKYSTSTALAKALNIKPQKPFAPYFGALVGVFGKTDYATVQDLRKKFQKALGNKVNLYNYGDAKIKNNQVAVVAGGGNEVDILKEIANNDINTFITGITAKNAFSKPAHEFAKKHKINILGGTHHSTEKFACIAMCDYFIKLGLPCEYIAGKPVLEDM